MTTAVILSDIHGNLPALRAVAEVIPRADRVIAAGDLCEEGPAPAQVLDMLRELGWTLITGNTDKDLVSPPPDAKDRKAKLIAWAREQLGEERLSILENLPFSTTIEEGGQELALVVHANPLNLEDHLYPTMTEEELGPYLGSVRAGLLAFGHLHIPYVRPVGGTVLVDVSSVGHPKDKDRRAAYTVVTWDGERRSIDQVRVPYDIEETVHMMRTSGMPLPEKGVAALVKASY